MRNRVLSGVWNAERVLREFLALADESGAAGDALGYAVEFDRYPEIVARYGQSGITEYELVNDIAEISDDTQMTLLQLCPNRHTWLSALPEFYSCLAPGNTCMSALKEMKEGRIPQNCYKKTQNDVFFMAVSGKSCNFAADYAKTIKKTLKQTQWNKFLSTSLIWGHLS